MSGLLTDPKDHQHKNVNHQENYVNPNTGAQTYAIERLLLHLKKSILRKKREVSPYLFQSHLERGVKTNRTNFLRFYSTREEQSLDDATFVFTDRSPV